MSRNVLMPRPLICNNITKRCQVGHFGGFIVHERRRESELGVAGGPAVVKLIRAGFRKAHHVTTRSGVAYSYTRLPSEGKRERRERRKEPGYCILSDQKLGIQL